MQSTLRQFRLLTILGWAVIVFMLSLGVASAELQVDAFLKQHCLECHADDTTEGGLDLQKLGRDLGDRGQFAQWEQVHDKILKGDMPPASAEQPAKEARQAILKHLAAELTTAHVAAKGTVLRRLNRREYENTMNDLFGVTLKLAERLPEDSRSHEFDNVGESLGISMVQLRQYMDCAGLVLDEAIVKTIDKPESKIVRASYADTRGAEQWINKIWLKRDDGAVVFFKEYGYPSGMLREANTERDGWYKVRVTGYAYQSETPVTFSIGGTTFQRGAEMPTYGFFSVPPNESTTVEITTWIPARYMIEITPWGLYDPNYKIRNGSGALEYEGPGLAIQHVEVEGPLTDQFPSRGHQLVFEGLDRHEVMPRNPKDREKSYYRPRFELTLADDAREIETALQRVAVQAFRHPVAASDVEPYGKLFRAERDTGATNEEALRTAITAMFCAPEFLYLRENAGQLDDHALACRLSYFLTRSAPDEELRQLADAGKLKGNTDVLLAQAERLLKHPHAERFITDFTDAWLNLREIEFTNPDAVLFPEFDRFLQFSMVDETRSFFRRLLDDNLGVKNFVKSDFAMLNNRLAEHYGIADVSGPEIRLVQLPADSVRGGFLSQASVLKVSANGTNTSPVVRGVWVMERMLGQAPPPPPAGVPGVEPDVRGASTLRELLDKHRALDSCKGCHQLIDPPGFALESFNPVGGWRDRFRSLGDGDKVDLVVHGQKVRYKQGPAVDASGELPDGRHFDNFIQFRDMLAQDEATLAKAFLTKLLTFSTGREPGFSDRPEIEAIVEKASRSGYGTRDMLKLVIASEAFQSK